MEVLGIHDKSLCYPQGQEYTGRWSPGDKPSKDSSWWPDWAEQVILQRSKGKTGF